MSRFKTQPVDTDNVGSWVERRRKGRMIRKQHTVTGAWSGWLFDYTTPRYTAERAVMNTLADVAETMGKMTVAELKALATTRGIPFKSKVTKPVLIAALADV